MSPDQIRDLAQLAAGRTVTRSAGNSGRLSPEQRAWLLMAPSLLAFSILVVIPLLAIAVLSLTNAELGAAEIAFIGVENYRQLALDATFAASLANTVFYVLMVVPTTVMLALVTAIAIEAMPSFRRFYRTVHVLPVMATMAAMALAWEILLNPSVGAVARLFGFFGLPWFNFLRDPVTVMPALALIGIWESLGFAMVLFIAGLATVPPDLYDAGAVDGIDSPFERLRLITLPSIKPVVILVLIVTTIRAFKVFDSVAILTQGGPGSQSEVLLHTIFTEAFRYLRTGYGSAMTVVFLVIVFLITSIKLYLSRVE
jgi:multiple sugar transport system permease protein